MQVQKILVQIKMWPFINMKFVPYNYDSDGLKKTKVGTRQVYNLTRKNTSPLNVPQTSAPVSIHGLQAQLTYHNSN